LPEVSSVFEAFVAKIGTAILKTAVAKVAFHTLKSIFRIETEFCPEGNNGITAVADASDVGVFGLEVASGILSDSSVEKALELSRGNFEVEKIDSGLLIAKNQLITDPISLAVPPEVIMSQEPVLYDFNVVYNANYGSSYNAKYSSKYSSLYRSRIN
jgi:hypothetical protein